MGLHLGVNHRSNLVNSSLSRVMRRAASRSTGAAQILAVPMRWSAIAFVLIAIITFSLASPRRTSAQDVPSATIELSGGSVAAGVGYTWGSGEVIFEGERHRIKASGLSVVQVGVSRYTASGSVYHMTKLSDIEGIYTALSAGAAVGGGASAIAMKNSKGVLIQMASMHQGVNLSLSAKGLDVSLK